MFIVTMVALCMHSTRDAVASAKDPNMKSAVTKHLLVAIVLSLLFGVGWAFGLIGTSSVQDEAQTAAQYIFSILMGIQGIAIFLLHAVLSREARKEWKKWWYTVTCRRNSYELKRRASFTVTDASRAHTLDISTAVIEKSMPYHEADEVVPLSPKNTASDEQEKEMQAAAAASTTVENVYVIEPTEDIGVPEKVDLSSADGKEDETSKL